MRLARYLPRFRAARAGLDALAERERWSRDEIDRFQLDRLNALWADSLADVPHYGRLAARHALPARFETLEEFRHRVPVLDKAQIRAAGQALVSRRAGGGRWHRTGGSTGEPLSVFWPDRDHRQALAAKYRFYASHGIGLFDPALFVWSRASGWGPAIRERLFDRLRNRRRVSVNRLDRRRLRRHLDGIERFRPAMIYGYSQAVHLLAREALRTGMDTDSVRLVVLTAEVATSTVRSTVERAFDAPVVMEYGATECPLIAGEAQDGAWRVREDVALVETAPRSDGRYDVLLTVLVNRGFPLFRYALGDVVDEPLHVPPIGFSSLAPVSGRNDELLISGRGEPVHPAIVDAVFEADPAIRRYRVHQGADGALLAWVEVDSPLPSGRRSELEADLAAALERPARVDVVERLETTTRGKHRPIRSALGPAWTPAGWGGTAAGGGSREPY